MISYLKLDTDFQINNWKSIKLSNFEYFFNAWSLDKTMIRKSISRLKTDKNFKHFLTLGPIRIDMEFANVEEINAVIIILENILEND